MGTVKGKEAAWQRLDLCQLAPQEEIPTAEARRAACASSRAADCVICSRAGTCARVCKSERRWERRCAKPGRGAGRSGSRTWLLWTALHRLVLGFLLSSPSSLCLFVDLFVFFLFG